MRAMFSSSLNLTVCSHQKRHRWQTQSAAVHFHWQLATKRFRHLSSSERHDASIKSNDLKLSKVQLHADWQQCRWSTNQSGIGLWSPSAPTATDASTNVPRILEIWEMIYFIISVKLMPCLLKSSTTKRTSCLQLRLNSTPPGTSWQQLGGKQPATTATAAACDSFGVNAQ